MYNYATDLCIYGNYASDNACCILAGFQVLGTFFCYWCVGGSFCNTIRIMQVTVSVAAMQLEEVSAAHAGECFCIKYVDDNFSCNYADGWESLLQLCWWYFLQCIMHMTLTYCI